MHNTVDNKIQQDLEIIFLGLIHYNTQECIHNVMAW